MASKPIAHSVLCAAISNRNTVAARLVIGLLKKQVGDSVCKEGRRLPELAQRERRFVSLPKNGLPFLTIGVRISRWAKLYIWE